MKPFNRHSLTRGESFGFFAIQVAFVVEADILEKAQGNLPYLGKKKKKKLCEPG